MQSMLSIALISNNNMKIDERLNQNKCRMNEIFVFMLMIWLGVAVLVQSVHGCIGLKSFAAFGPFV